jgi:hypothetical protein
MIQAFPDLYPDELMYSGYARYSYRVGYPNLKNVTNELFSSRHIIASIPFASHLQYFVAHQPRADRFTTASLIAEHTLLPFYNPFLPQDRIQQLQMDICGMNGPGVYMRVGLMASIVPSPQYLQYCPECAKEDQMRFGEMYWHRHHQIPGVSVCHIHKVWLDQSNVQVHNRKTRHKFISAEETLRSLSPARPIDTSFRFHDILLFLANGASWLLRQRNLSPGLEFLCAAYKKALISQDLATYSGRVQMTELQEAFASYYPDSILSYLHCNLNRHSPDNWLARLVRKPDGSQHPLQHLLLIRFLDCTIETFFASSLDSPPFGIGPWPCLNTTSDHYRQCQIEQCEIVHGRYVDGRPVGTFSCSCGFVYSRTGPDTTVEDQFRFSKVKVFGQIWETRLQALWEDEAVSLRAIARQLGVDPLTVKRHASHLGLPFPRPGGKSSELRENQQLCPHTLQLPEVTIFEAYRTTWLTLLQENAGAGITKLRSVAPRIYTWLYRHDKIWLKEHTPASSKNKKVQNHRVDWEERDIQLAEEVIIAALHLKNLPGRPVYITLSAIGREIGQVSLLQQHLDKLPRTAEALEEQIESREAYAVRRVWWTAIEFAQKNIYPEQWQLIGRAGVARLAGSPQVKDAIDAALQALEQARKLAGTTLLHEFLRSQ